MSILERLSKNHCSSPSFWQVQTPNKKIQNKRLIFKAHLNFSVSQPTRENQLIYLTKNYIYFYTSQSTLNFAYIKWSLFKPFTEVDKNNNIFFGFSICSNSNSCDFYTESEQSLNEWADKLSSVLIMTSFESEYCILKEIDSGQFGSVCLCENITTREQFAVKRILKSNLTSIKRINYLFNEVLIQRKLDHPNIVKLYKVYEDDDSLNLLMEYVKGGNLFNFIKNQKKIDDSEFYSFSKSFLEVINYMHSFGVIHRDIKPENILLERKDEVFLFKIADFGLSCFAKNNETYCSGSPGYMAPEMLKGLPYNNKVDIFSAGVVLYIMITGISPFGAQKTQEIIEKNIVCRVNFSSRYFRNVSLETAQIIRALLNPNQVMRPSAEQVLRVERFRELNDENDSVLVGKGSRSFSTDVERYPKRLINS